MDNRPLGVFDSGLGGLTAVKELQKVMPGEDIVYFGDTGRVPYGTRSRETIIKYTREDIALLLKFDVKAVLIACGTVSSVALPSISSDYSLPVCGVVLPAAKTAANVTKNGRIGIIATPATVRSGGYEHALHECAGISKVLSVPCPLLVPLVEAGRIATDDAVTRMVLSEYLAPVVDFKADTLILGCTHYPLLSEIIRGILPGVTLIDSGAALAAYTARSGSFERGGKQTGGETRFFVSDNTEGFASISRLFLERDAGTVEFIRAEAE